MSPRLSYQQGDHVCALYSTPAEQLTSAIEYIRGGLARGERCLYVCCEHDAAEFRAALEQAGIDVGGEEQRTALVIVTKDQGHLKGCSFEPAKMIEMLKTAVQDALDAGFAGLCAAGDMNWVLDGAPGSENLVQYEALLNHFFRSHRALGLCLYNRRTLPAEVLDHCLATHPYVRVEGPLLFSNPFYETPQAAVLRTANPAGIDERIDAILGL